ncbi:L-threonylcarbamoyladenylate synthase [Rubripirellula reticaptiva]|uniref:L-threonylcarbamoyladenylate synthase n=1 Tax=Rubripirellula reticaptiva TaxID=2528013 RepID=A0A5C6F5D7_9BACT|nr:L-threonylcarbamoyladenylate synthase [Rubripirellula reticaptiva]TWU56212.1 Low molecular weight protein-tyrosine-phosphatase YwlE [Rubripirellula reticaptiva]
MSIILDLRATDDPRDIVHRSVQALVEGEVVGVPTDTVYGLAASALSERAVERLCEIKGRANWMPIAISVGSRESAEDFYCGTSPLARRLASRCWPGPLTLVIPCNSPHSAVTQLPQGVQDRIRGEFGCVGFRVVNHRVITHIHRFLSAPLLLTSANLTGQPVATTADQVQQQLGDLIPLLLDDGPTRYGGASTVARVQGNQMEILREGVIERAAMNQFVKPVIALVCTGNTCRSPMAETLLRDQMSKKYGCEDAVRVLSAGVAANPGCGATPQAIEVMGNRGLDLTGHSSRTLDESVMGVADLVLTMTRGHRAAILAAWPGLHDRVFTLRRDGGDIGDPVGMPVDVYEACADQIEGELQAWAEALGDDFFPQAIGSSDPESDSTTDQA